ncbi:MULTISPECIES: hypothetical protein [unclassified Microcoleus]|uniref:hypothetical protein n=1 Tax=unclassified Microcoleus TaxID=2642155 RepID=UPI0025DFE9EC|nr:MULTISPECIES: hypothetical protein [unclassified Microcoleus]
MFSLKIDFGQTLLAQTSFCPHPNLIRIIASICLLLFLGFILFTMSGLIIATIGATSVPVVGGFFLFKIIASLAVSLGLIGQIPLILTNVTILGVLTVISGAVIWGIKFITGCG